MRKPRFDNRAYDTVMNDDGIIWYIVFPSLKAKEQFNIDNPGRFEHLKHTTICRPFDAYKTDLSFINNLGFTTIVKTRHRESNPRIGDKVWLQDDDDLYGEVELVDYREQEVCVRFNGETRYYSFDELAEQWTDKFGGVYVLED